jgi:hypothetical protein
MQYTIRDIPRQLDVELRERARREGKSLNQVAVEAMAQGLGLGETSAPRRSVEDVAGTWKKQPAVERALADQDRVDPGMWNRGSPSIRTATSISAKGWRRRWRS